MLTDIRFLNFVNSNLGMILFVTSVALVWLITIIEGNSLQKYKETNKVINTTYTASLLLLILAMIAEAVLSHFSPALFQNIKTLAFALNLVLAIAIIITTIARAYLFTVEHGFRQSAILWAVPAIYLVFVTETMYALSY